jgi:hypothetical protein
VSMFVFGVLCLGCACALAGLFGSRRAVTES